MGIGSISFWQADQNWWSSQQAQAQSAAAETSLINAMESVETNLGSGMASLATKAAITRVNNQIAADEKALAASSGSSSTGQSPSGPAPASATGTVPLTTSTSLSTLGIPPNGTITVSDGTNTTTYNSTGTDTVADLIGAINANVAGNAYVTASLNSAGNLVITGKNQKEPVIVGGTFASDVGFGPGHQSFQPTAGSASSSSGSTPSASTTSTSAASSGSTTGSSSQTSSSTTAVPSLESENASSAASMLSDFGVAGSLVNMLV